MRVPQTPAGLPPALRGWAEHIRSYLEDAAKISAEQARVITAMEADLDACRAYIKGQLTGPQPFHRIYSEIGANWTIGDSELNTVLDIKCTGASDATLPGAREACWLLIRNSGSAAITVKDSGTAICTIPADSWAMINCLPDSTGAAVWPTMVPVFGKDGSEYVGAPASSKDASALVEINSTTKGFLPPRMTTAQRDAISSPATGLIIYNTTTGQLEAKAAGAWGAA